MNEKDILICGAGPAGLGAAWRLTELSQTRQDSTDWLLLDSASTPGGMAMSQIQGGFTWDLGGHVLFPHYPYFDKVLNEVVDNWVEVKPVRGAWMFDRFIPYPVQRNIRHFPQHEIDRCLQGLAHIAESPADTENFERHLTASFGQGLYDLFFKPLNLKMWGTHPKEMSADWARHRSGSKASNVPTVDLQRIMENIKNKRDDVAWTEDTRTRYPATGGTGSIWQGVTAKLPAERLQFNQEIVSVELRNRVATLSSGCKVAYENFFTSMPIDKLLGCFSDCPELSKYADLFKPAAVDVIGIGVRGKCPDQLTKLCSLYLPDEEISFWRASMLSNYSASMAPPDTWSILCEINSGPSRPAVTNPIASVIDGLQQLGFASPDNIVSTWHRHLPYGYPVPTPGRDEALAEIQQLLETNGIFSRGRFGGWKYEVCNQDHAFMQGVEVVDALVDGATEITYPTPYLVGK